MTPREVETLRARLAAIVNTASALSLDAEDLYWLAYEKSSATHEVKVAGGRGPAGLDTVGDPRARRSWNNLERATKAAEISLVKARQDAGNLLAEGRIDDQIRFGSALTPEGMDEVLGYQAKRQSHEGKHPIHRDYNPHRTEEQPKHPGRKTGTKKNRRRR